ncbi:hypothetical protein GWI33_004569 [Rhynchophorus ferrugineus]|uniref:Uncharacterized protein n=1 Tax=Rhynchophorus ferrugineus TaxID=354439 RepID=A0A834MKB4_RHYFE|nr:hypothetical protein GWI33_004569 [Rhynchophorus ferrugineus]
MDIDQYSDSFRAFGVKDFATAFDYCVRSITEGMLVIPSEFDASLIFGINLILKLIDSAKNTRKPTFLLHLDLKTPLFSRFFLSVWNAVKNKHTTPPDLFEPTPGVVFLVFRPAHFQIQIGRQPKVRC